MTAVTGDKMPDQNSVSKAGEGKEPRASGPDHPDTKLRLLDAAELVFAEQGFASATTREVCQRAGVNQALIHYYFGSKLQLLEQVVARRATTIVEERLKLLAEAQREAGDRAPALEKILYCFVAPPLLLAKSSPGGLAFARIIARLHHDPVDSAKRLIEQTYTASTQRFVRALSANLPEMSIETICWRLSFMIGAYQHALSQAGRLEAISEGRCDSSDVDTAISEMIPFLAAGFRAPAPIRA